MNLAALNNQAYKIQSTAVVAKKPEQLNETPVKDNSIKEEKTQDTNKAVKITVGKAVSTVNFIESPSKLKSISASTQTALKASSSNDIVTSLGLSVGGAAVGLVVAKVVGRKAAPIALLGSSIGSLVDRGIGISKNTDKIKESYQTGKTDATKLETAINAVGFVLDIAAVASAGELIKLSRQSPKITGKISLSDAPASEGFRQYKPSEELVGKNSGKNWEYSVTEGVPSPNKLAQIKGTSKVSGAEAFLNKEQNIKLQGANVEEIVSKIPKEAKLRELTPSATIKEGFEYAWVDKKSNMDYRVRVHGADSGVAKHNPTSTAAQGWIVRVERNPVGERSFPKTEYLTLDGTYHKTTELMGYEKKKKEAELTLSVIKDYQTATIGDISMASGSQTVGQVDLLKKAASTHQENIQLVRKATASSNIEHFHHNTHIAVGGGLNPVIK